MKLQSSLAALALAGLTAQGAIVIETGRQTNGTSTLNHTYVPSTTDLIHGLATTSQEGTFNREGSGGTPVLTDGLFPALSRALPNPPHNGAPFPFGIFATAGSDTIPDPVSGGFSPGGLTLTYTLPEPTSLSSIVVYGGWQDSGRDEQSYNIYYSTALAPTVFTLLTTVDYNPPSPGSFPIATRVAISDDTGVLAADVAAIRFDFTETENGYSGYAEIDVFAVPEPVTAVMLLGGIGMLGLFRRRVA